MADITNGFLTRRVTLTANTEQVVLFPDGVKELTVVNMGSGTVCVKPNGKIGATTDDKAFSLNPAAIRSVTLRSNNREGLIRSISLLSAAADEVQWVANAGGFGICAVYTEPAV